MENVFGYTFMALFYGSIATGAMSLLLLAFNRTGTTHAYLIKGIGSSIPTQEGGSLVPGLFIYLSTGAVAGLIYMLVGQEIRWGWTGPDLWWSKPAILLLFGALTGVARGLATNGLLWMVAFDQKPKAHIARAGLGVVAIHSLGQVVYGLSLSVLFGLTRIVGNLEF